jgi:spermidine/putrescine ABC transporter ATP-binding subunit
MSERMQHGLSVRVSGLTKSYGPVMAVDNVSIDIGAGEFLALLGPSGSGKTTILMTLAGFETPSRGEIMLDGRRITDLPPHRRGIGMVFQRYALFPHMTVAENIAYPLRRRDMDAASIRREVGRALELVCLPGLGARYPAQLSGGQQQRVALARALVFNPPVLLMDEPLGALDRKLRQQMQMEIKLLHGRLGTTVIFVTHDQEEALSMADRIAVLHQGKLQQLGTPSALYERPANAFVAGFIGETNFLPVELSGRTDEESVYRLAGIETSITVPNGNLCTDQKQALLAVRPEHLQLTQSGQGIEAEIIETAYAGATLNVLLSVGPHRLMARIGTGQGGSAPAAGERVAVVPLSGSCLVYAADTHS